MDLKELADRLNGDNPAGWAWTPQDTDPDTTRSASRSPPPASPVT